MRVLFGHNKDQGGHFLVGHGFSSASADAIAAYTLAGISPSYVMDTENGVYYEGTYYDGPNQLHDHATTSSRTVVDSEGAIKWAPMNLAANPASPSTQSITVVVGNKYRVNVIGSGSMTLSGAGTGTASQGSPADITATTTTLTITLSGSLDYVGVHRNEFSMQASGSAIADWYVPETAYWMGTDHDPVTNAVRGVQGEPAATNLLLNSGTLSTQNVTTTNVAHTLHFTGAGTVALSGTSTAGPLVGTGAGESNRVSLTFTPTAGTLTLTVSGTVTNAQLETGSLATSYIPTAGATATRAAPSVTKPTGEFMPLGGNIVSNGGFDTDASGWTIGGSGAYNSGAVDLDVPGATVALSQSVGVNPVGKLWRLEYTITNHVSGNLRPQFGSTNGAFNTGNGTFVDYIFANSTNSTLLFVNGGTAYQATIDSISIKEVQQDEIVVVTEFECADVAADAVIAALDNASTDLIHFRAHTSQANLFVQDGGVTQADVDAGAISANTQYRAAFKMAADDFLASLGGATAVADTSGTMPTPTTLRLFNSSGGAPLAGIKVKKLIVYAGAAGALDAIDATAIEGASA